MQNKLREMYKQGQVPVGTFFSMGDMNCMECLGFTGMDYVIIDTEHGPYDTESMMDLIRVAEKVNLSPIVRIADVTHKEIQRAADCGADGLIVPCLRTVDEYKKLVDLAKFAPIGNRGFIKGRGSSFGNQPWATGTLEEYMANSNEKLMLLPQCETVESLEAIEEIVAIDGIDGIFIGPFDLSISMGIPAKFDAPEFVAALDRIIAACKAAKKPVYIYTNNAAESKLRMKQGADGIACSITSIEFTNVFKKLVKDIKE